MARSVSAMRSLMYVAVGLSMLYFIPYLISWISSLLNMMFVRFSTLVWKWLLSIFLSHYVVFRSDDIEPVVVNV